MCFKSLSHNGLFKTEPFLVSVILLCFICFNICGIQLLATLFTLLSFRQNGCHFIFYQKAAACIQQESSVHIYYSSKSLIAVIYIVAVVV